MEVQWNNIDQELDRIQGIVANNDAKREEDAQAEEPVRPNVSKSAEEQESWDDKDIVNLNY